MSDSQTINAAVTAKLAELGIVYTVRHMGQIEKPAQTKDGKPWPCDQWRVTFEKRDANYHGPSVPANCFSTDYFTGMGHRKIPKAQRAAYEHELKARHSSWREATTRKYAAPVAPDVAGVLHSLTIDAEAANTSFGYWCDNFGYDSDSINALNTYQACEKIGRELLQFFGHAALLALADIVKEF